MSAYDLEMRRLLCSERVDQLRRDARTVPASAGRNRRRRRWRVALAKLVSGPAAYRASVES